MSRGGNRIGAGRPLGRTNQRDKSGVRLSLIAQPHMEAAIDTLVDIMKNSNSAAARTTAACALLDRACGRPPAQSEDDFVEADEHKNIVYRTLAEVHQEMIDLGTTPESLRRLADDLQKHLESRELNEPAAFDHSISASK